ncbi:helix-turn-helix transcriptional regulator [Rhodococcus sp. 14C212]|nr:helix-turn-helix transcriptional regulator [Rhodococcus sp. 14C212]
MLECLVAGSSNREIGQKLSIAESAGCFHVGHILRKLRARTRAEAIALGWMQQQLDLPSFRRTRPPGHRPVHRVSPAGDLRRLPTCLFAVLSRRRRGCRRA